jgi:hypothetical protein
VSVSASEAPNPSIERTFNSRLRRLLPPLMSNVRRRCGEAETELI